MKETKRVIKEMLTGMAVWEILLLLVLELLSRGSLSVVAGVLLGTVTAAGLLFHMYRHLDIALDLDETGARRHMHSATMQRMMIMTVAIAAALLLPSYISPMGTILGIFGLKVSALLQPTVHRVLTRFKNTKR